MTKFTLMSGVAVIALTVAVGANAQGDDDITTYGPETFTVDEFEVDSLVGTIEIIIEDRSDIEIFAQGEAGHMERFGVDTYGDTVGISYEATDFRWSDWSTWVSWWNKTSFDADDYPTVTVRLPEGTPVDVDNMTGNFTMGNLNGPFRFESAGATEATIGTLSSANIHVAGAGDITLGDVAGSVLIDVAGAADIRGQSAQSLELHMSGASDVGFTDIRGGLDVSIAGIGELDVDSVNGAVDISIAGAGDLNIDDGYAEAFEVSIAGAGDVRFGGTAMNPSISIAGSGDVYIERYEGRLNHSGQGDITIGSGS